MRFRGWDGMVNVVDVPGWMGISGFHSIQQPAISVGNETSPIYSWMM